MKARAERVQEVELVELGGQLDLVTMGSVRI